MGLNPVIICSVLVLLGTMLGISSGQYPAAPHIIVFMVDDLGWNDVGFHGSNEIPTPNIDALAYNGLILNRHYVLPSCTPTRASFFTGKYPLKIGMQGANLAGGEPRGLPLNVRILPEYLRDLGYTPRLVGKWHLGFHTRQHTPQHRGFDSFFGFYNGHISYYNYEYRNGNMTGFDLQRNDQPAHDIRERYATHIFTEEAVRIIDRHDARNPLYLQINHLGVHAPLEPPVPGYYGYYNHQNFSYLRGDRQKYAMMVSEIDNSLGTIVATLGDKNLLNDSIIVFLTDNGAPQTGEDRNAGSNWPLRGGKYSLYEGGVRGVAAIWSPRLRNMADVSYNLMHVADWLPTLYSAAGGNPKELGSIDGLDFWPHFSKNNTQTPRESLIININEHEKTEAAIYRRWKLVRGRYRDGNYDFYYGHNGKNYNVPPYDFDAIHNSAVVSAFHSHLGQPVTQRSKMTSLREKATVQDYHELKYNDSYPCRNETECLFDIVQDPWELDNVAKLYPNVVSKLDSLLEANGRRLKQQLRTHPDWNADPRLHNRTWVPWLPPSIYETLYGYNPNGATATIGTIAVSAHIAMALLIVGLRAFI